MAPTPVHQPLQEIGIRNQDIIERVAANRLPPLSRVDQSVESGPVEPNRGLVENAGQPLPVKQLGQFAVVDAGNGPPIGKPRLHVREVPAKVRAQ